MASLGLKHIVKEITTACCGVSLPNPKGQQKEGKPVGNKQIHIQKKEH